MSYANVVKLSDPAIGSTYDISAYAARVSIQRGRTAPTFPDIDAGSCTVVFNNETRAFDPLYASSPYNGLIIPGSVLTVFGSVSGSEVQVFGGRVEDWNLDYNASTRSSASAEAADALAELGRREFDEWTTTNGDLPWERLLAVLTRPEVDLPWSTSFDHGVTYLQGDYVSWESNVLNYCQLIARTDLGFFFASRENVVRYADRLANIGATAIVPFGSALYPTTGLGVSYGRETLFNRVSVTRFGGEPQIVDDSTSIATYGVTRSLVLTELLMQDDTQALNLATLLLSAYKDPSYRFESVTIAVNALADAQQSAVLALDIGFPVSVTFTPNNVGGAITRTCVVEGIRHDITPELHEITFTLGDSAIYQFDDTYTVDDATFGYFDAGGVLEYPIAS